MIAAGRPVKRKLYVRGRVARIVAPYNQRFR